MVNTKERYSYEDMEGMEVQVQLGSTCQIGRHDEKDFLRPQQQKHVCISFISRYGLTNHNKYHSCSNMCTFS